MTMQNPNSSGTLIMMAALLWLSAWTAVAPSALRADDLPFVNWENHPVHALDISPDGRTLAATHTADGRVQLFDISESRPIPIGHIVVGIDPVSVRFRTDDELWVVNHISDTVSVIDLQRRITIALLQTDDEPFDVVFAGNPQRAFVSCSQANTVKVYDPADLSAEPLTVEIAAEDPRALAVSADGGTVFAAIFESGNGSTILAGGQEEDQDVLQFPPNVVSDPAGPYGGVNPPPNEGGEFFPARRTGQPDAPAVGLIVRRDTNGRWMDDNDRDWTAMVSGVNAAASGRIPGWTLIDRDIAVIDAVTLEVSYAESLMNIGMAIAVNPATAKATLVGTDAENQIRFEPNLNGRFLRVLVGQVDDTGGTQLHDLNGHLDYSGPRIEQARRDLSLGDPRGIVWQQDGQRGYVSGMGSNNVIVINSDGSRAADTPIGVGEGPTGLALDEARQRLYVWNHFDTSLSVIDTSTLETVETVAVFNPLPQAIRQGRPLLYDTRLTSGLGHVSCASCHIDGRMDRLAWDLGDPSGEMKTFNQNCVTTVNSDPCEDFHPMKGPMATQTLQDIIGNEPFHWRGDRDGIEEFNPAFVGLLGDDRELSAEEMQRFEDHLATITFPPNPFRNLDNSLPDSIALTGQVTSGRFSPAGQPLPDGDPKNALKLFNQDLLDSPFQCASCHTLPTGMAVNGPLLLGNIGASAGGSIMETGPLGENHLGIVSVDGSTNKSIKVPHLRNMYDKVGFEMSVSESRAGFGFLHDGSVDSLSRFLSARAFDFKSDQEVADMVALMMAFAGSDLGDNPILSTEPPVSKDSHAAVGTQIFLNDGAEPPDALLTLYEQARAGRIDLVVHSLRQGRPTGWVYQADSDQFQDSAGGEPVGKDALIDQASPMQPQTWTAVSAGLGRRFGLDRDMDGVGDRVEIAQWSDPTDPQSNTLQPHIGHWYNPQRSGHGMDVQRLGNFMFVTWFTYNDDGSPTWYQASNVYSPDWQADMYRFAWNPDTGKVDGEIVGTMSMAFSDAEHAEFRWQIGEQSGSEPVRYFLFDDRRALRDYTGMWYDRGEPGWGFSAYSQGQTRFFVLYFYDENHQPRWVLGQDDNQARSNVPMFSFQGFCPACDRVQPQSSDAGSLTVDYRDSRSGTIDIAVSYPALPASDWIRNGADISALSDAQPNPADY